MSAHVRGILLPLRAKAPPRENAIFVGGWAGVVIVPAVSIRV